MTVAKAFSVVSQPPSSHDLAKALLSYTTWDWHRAKMNEDHFGSCSPMADDIWSNMAEYCRLLHVRALSSLGALRLVQSPGYKTGPVTRLVKETIVVENEFFMYVREAVGDVEAFEKALSAELVKLFWMVDHVMVSAKEHDVFYPIVGAPFDPASMEVMPSETSPAIASGDARQYRVVLCVWPGLMSMQEDLSHLKVPYKHVVYPARRDDATDGPCFSTALVYNKDFPFWRDQDPEPWKKPGVEVVG